MTGNKLLCLRETWSHMAEVSGFDPLCRILCEQWGGSTDSLFVANGNPKIALPLRLLKKAGLLRHSPASRGSSPSPFVEERHELAGSRLLQALQQSPGSIALLSAGENQYGGVLAKASAAVRRRLVVCLHQPPSWHRLHWRSNQALDGLGAIISLCDEQSAYLQTVTSTPILKIQHGVDSSFFSPGPEDSQPAARLLFVGQWLRDFDTLARSMEVIWASQPMIELDCVVPHSARNHPAIMQLARNPQVRWHAGVTPERLRELYQQATLLFLPVIDSTANNAIVEALACGLPIVSTKVGGMRDYVTDNCGILCQAGDANAHADAALRLFMNPRSLALRRQACRTHATTHLQWAGIVGQLAGSLKKLPAAG